MQIDKLVLEAEYVGDASMAPREYMTVTSTTQACACSTLFLVFQPLAL